MKLTKTLSTLLLVSIFIGCNDIPDICTEAKPMPVLFSIFNKFDSINYVVLTKTFSGDNGGSLVNAKIWDSIYFREAIIKVVLYYPKDHQDTTSFFRTDTVQLYAEIGTNREPGIFGYPDFQQFVLRRNLFSYGSYSLLVQIPSYNLEPLSSDFAKKPEILLTSNQLTLRPDESLFIRWNRLNSSADDVKIDFFISTINNGRTSLDTISFTKYTMIPHDNPLPYGQTSLTYEKFLGLLNVKFKNNSVEYRQITSVTVTLTSASNLGAGVLTDYYLTYVEPDNTKYDPNAFGGFMGSRASTIKTGLKIDPSSLAIMNQQPEFAKFRIVQW